VCIVVVVGKFEMELPLNERMCRIKLRELFMRNKDVTDIRNIDLLVIRVSVINTFLFYEFCIFQKHMLVASVWFHFYCFLSC